MIICDRVVSIVFLFVRTMVQIVHEIVSTVCDWVTTTITTFREVVETVCSWLPWPLDKLCDLVVTIIKIVETIVEWVCEEVIERIFEWIEVILVYVEYIVRWVCWLITLPFRIIGLLQCWITRGRGRRTMPVCVVIISNENNELAASEADVAARMADAAAILDDQCNIDLVVVSTRVERQPAFFTGTSCDFGGMFTGFFQWFSNNASASCITVYVVRDISGAGGCSYPGTNWVTIDGTAGGSVIVQEIGHSADIWLHSDDPDNVMSNGPGARNQLTHFQCCLLRTSRFSRVAPFFPVIDIAGWTNEAARTAAVRRSRLPGGNQDDDQ